MSDSVVVLVSPNGREHRLSEADVAAGRQADLEARGYKRRSAVKGPSKAVRSSEPSKDSKSE